MILHIRVPLPLDENQPLHWLCKLRILEDSFLDVAKNKPYKEPFEVFVHDFSR